MIDKKPNFLNLIDSKLTRTFIKYLPLVSLLITNFIVFLIFSHFFAIRMKSLFFWVLLSVGFIFSLIVLRTNYVLFTTLNDIIKSLFYKIKSFLSKIKKNKIKGKKDKKLKLNKITSKTIKIGLGNATYVIIKNLYFNILNDSFILAIIWTSVFGLVYLLNPSKIPNNFNFQNFATTITLVGVLSGFFQFYIKNYKEQVSKKVADSISKYLINEINKINFKDFMLFMKNLDENEIKNYFNLSNKERQKNNKLKHLKTLTKRINKIILDEDRAKKNRTFQGIKCIHQIFLSFKIEPSYLFDYLDYYKEFKEESLNKQWLKESYNAYFKKKYKDFKKQINKEDLMEIRKLLFSSIFFFDEIQADLEKSTLDFKDIQKKELNDFRDFYKKFTYDCVYYMLDALLNFKQEDK